MKNEEFLFLKKIKKEIDESSTKILKEIPEIIKELDDLYEKNLKTVKQDSSHDQTMSSLEEIEKVALRTTIVVPELIKWINLKIPKTEENSENLIQDNAINLLQAIDDRGVNALAKSLDIKSLRRKHLKRISKYPREEEYQKTLTLFDKYQSNQPLWVIAGLRDGYVRALNFIDLNREKILSPKSRTTHETNYL